MPKDIKSNRRREVSSEHPDLVVALPQAGNVIEMYELKVSSSSQIRPPLRARVTAKPLRESDYMNALPSSSVATLGSYRKLQTAVAKAVYLTTGVEENSV